MCKLLVELMLRNWHFLYSICFQVDGDGRNPLPSGGQDSLAAAAAAALLSVANVGTGYTGFV